MRSDNAISRRWFRRVRLRLAAIYALSVAVFSGAVLLVVFYVETHMGAHACVAGHTFGTLEEHSQQVGEALIWAWAVISGVSAVVGYVFAPFITRAAEDAMENLSRTSDSIAHDLRAPLTRLSVRSEMEAAKEGPSSEFAVSVASDVQDMLVLVNTLLEIAHLERDGEEQRLEPVDLCAVMRDTIELFAPLAEANGIRLLNAAPSEPVLVNASRAKIMQVSNNLVDNAIKHTQKGNWVSVKVERNGGNAIYTVSDFGDGIPADELPHVFEKFFRGKRNNSAGNGLGLALVRAIVESYGGRISATSSPGLGATFTAKFLCA